MILRLHEVMLLLEQTTAPVMLVVNKAVLRVIFAYFKGTSVDKMPYLPVPGHTSSKYSPEALPPMQVIEMNRIHKGFEAVFHDLSEDPNNAAKGGFTIERRNSSYETLKNVRSVSDRI